jgi:hypothetical protein
MSGPGEEKIEVEDTIIWPPTHFARCLEVREQASKVQPVISAAQAFASIHGEKKLKYCSALFSYLKGLDLEENIRLG